MQTYIVIVSGGTLNVSDCSFERHLTMAYDPRQNSLFEF